MAKMGWFLGGFLLLTIGIGILPPFRRVDPFCLVLK